LASCFLSKKITSSVIIYERGEKILLTTRESKIESFLVQQFFKNAARRQRNSLRHTPAHGEEGEKSDRISRESGQDRSPLQKSRTNQPLKCSGGTFSTNQYQN
jgi:hypothetical protein